MRYFFFPLEAAAAVFPSTPSMSARGCTAGNRSTIQAPLGRRDNLGAQAEHFFVSLDTYHDRRTAYTFGVSASGVRIDRYHPRDDEESADAGFDPVWEAKTAIDEQGWTAELWIPFAQLRFIDTADQIWGLNIGRFTPTLEEEDYWVAHPAHRARVGVALRRAARHPRRAAEPPHRAAPRRRRLVDAQRRTAIAANPFDDGQNLLGRVGADFKMGLGPEPDARRDLQSGFRTGRSRSRGSQPVGVRHAISRAAAVLHSRARGC